jgi:hypothetical protein
VIEPEWTRYNQWMSCFKYIGSHWTDVPRGGNHQPENKKSHIFLCYQCLEPDPNMQLDVFVSIGFKMVWIWKGVSCTYSWHGAIVPIHCSPQVKLKWRAFFVVARMTCHGSCGLMTWIDEVSSILHQSSSGHPSGQSSLFHASGSKSGGKKGPKSSILSGKTYHPI